MDAQMVYGTPRDNVEDDARTIGIIGLAIIFFQQLFGYVSTSPYWQFYLYVSKARSVVDCNTVCDRSKGWCDDGRIWVWTNTFVGQERQMVLHHWNFSNTIICRYRRSYDRPFQNFHFPVIKSKKISGITTLPDDDTGSINNVHTMG